MWNIQIIRQLVPESGATVTEHNRFMLDHDTVGRPVSDDLRVVGVMKVVSRSEIY